jgi:hypothetical protein
VGKHEPSEPPVKGSSITGSHPASPAATCTGQLEPLLLRMVLNGRDVR